MVLIWQWPPYRLSHWGWFRYVLALDLEKHAIPSAYDIHSSPWKFSTHAIKNGVYHLFRLGPWFFFHFALPVNVITRGYLNHPVDPLI